jgi:hypothetical protein
MHLTEELTLDRRDCPRTAVASTIYVRPIGAFNYQVLLHDLSVAGCRVELVEETEIGEAVIARFPQLEPLVGAIRWKGGATAGLEFSHRMHPAVLDALVTRLP